MLKPIDHEKRFVIGTPLVGWKCDRNEDMTWLENRLAIHEMFPNSYFFAALELDHRGLEPFQRVLTALEEVDGLYWAYTINDHQAAVTSENRWIRIETGRNLIREYAQREALDAVLYVDSDIVLNVEIIEKLLEVDHPLVGVDVPQYGLSGKVVSERPPIQEHWTTAGMLLVNAPAFYDLPWHHNLYIGLSDDPAFQYMACRLQQHWDHGVGDPYGQTWVRKDVKADHRGQLIAVEQRRIPMREL